MVKCSCIEVLRDSRGHINGYVLKDKNDLKVYMKPKELKLAIINCDVVVNNMTLTSNNRLLVRKKKNRVYEDSGIFRLRNLIK